MNYEYCTVSVVLSSMILWESIVVVAHTTLILVYKHHVIRGKRINNAAITINLFAAHQQLKVNKLRFRDFMATHRHHHIMLNYWTTKPQTTYSYLQVRPLVVYHEESVIKVRYKPCDVRSSYNPSLSVVCSLHWIAFVYESFVDAIFNLTQCSILFHSSASIVRGGREGNEIVYQLLQMWVEGWLDWWIKLRVQSTLYWRTQ